MKIRFQEQPLEPRQDPTELHIVEYAEVPTWIFKSAKCRICNTELSSLKSHENIGVAKTTKGDIILCHVSCFHEAIISGE